MAYGARVPVCVLCYPTPLDRSLTVDATSLEWVNLNDKN